ncbi:aliphatic sulfonate ABC transporter substrate-binding protein [Effusibacillus consociatus]|uniref:Aliphatic sulfonate ABC transporter substrate-binding protein n=1 Tax=Effusibacillus consociatus TaxID=1117041 RepID=A0ABV9Q759_9BACL
MKLIIRKWWASVVLIFSMVILSACGSSSSTKQSNSSPGTGDQPTEIRIGYQVIPNAELLAKAIGIYEKKFEGVKVNWRQFDSARDVNTAITSGSIDFGLIGSSSVATGVAQNLPYQVIWLHDVIGDNEALVVKKGSGINTFSDVVGKKIAVPFGSTTHYSFLSALKLNGIDQSKVTLLDMQPQDMLAAWKQGQIDGGYVWYPILGKMIDDGGKVLLTSRDLSKKGIVTADVCVASKSFIQKYPAMVTKYIEALDEAVKFYRSNKGEAVKAMAKELNVSESDAGLFMDQLIWLDASEQAGSNHLGTTNNKGAFAQALKDTGEFMVTQKSIPSAPALDVYQQAIQSQFVSKVKESKSGK